MNIFTFIKMLLSDEKTNLLKISKKVGIGVLILIFFWAMFVPSFYILTEVYPNIPYFKLFSFNSESSIDYGKMFIATLSSPHVFLIAAVAGFFTLFGVFAPFIVIVIILIIVLIAIYFIGSTILYFTKKWNLYKDKLKDKQ